MGGYYLLKSNGGDSGNRIFVLYWRCPLIRGSTVIQSALNNLNIYSESEFVSNQSKIQKQIK
jgi:hypothetical protein